MWHLGKPTIARVQGWAMAGGFGLALACDLVVASDRARFGAPELDVGLWPYMVTVPMLRSMPPKKALELMLTSRVVDAEEAGPHRVRHPRGPPRPARRRGGRAGRRAGLETAGCDEAGPRIVLRCAGLGGHRGAALPPRHAHRHQPDGRGGEGIAAFIEKRPPAWQDWATGRPSAGHESTTHQDEPEEPSAWRNEH